MQFSIERFELLHALNTVKGVVKAKTTFPILSHVLLVANGDGITAHGSNLDEMTSCSAGADVTKHGGVCVPMFILHQAVQKLADGCKIDMKSTKDVLHVEAGRTKFHLSVLPTKDFPRIDKGRNDYDFTTNSSTLCGVLTSVRAAQSTEETRPAIRGVNLSGQESLLKFVAINGAGAHTSKSEMSGKLPQNVTITTETVSEIIRLCKSIGGDVHVVGNEAVITLNFENISFSSKLIDGDFPDYHQFIKDSHDTKINVDRMTLIGAVDRVSTFAQDGDNLLRFDFDGDNLTISNEKEYEHGGNETLVIDGGGNFSFGFNFRRILDLLNATENRDVVLSFKAGDEQNNLCHVTFSDDKSFFGFVVNYKISERKQQVSEAA